MTKQRARERAKARAAAKAAPQAHDVKAESKARAGQPGKGGAKEGAGPKFDGSANIRSAAGTKAPVRPTRGAARSR